MILELIEIGILTFVHLVQIQEIQKYVIPIGSKSYHTKIHIRMIQYKLFQVMCKVEDRKRFYDAFTVSAVCG